LLHVTRQAGFVSIDEYQVIGGIGQTGQDIARAAGNGAGSVGRTSCLRKCLPGSFQVFHVHIDGGQDGL
jgi:hypothetical protein